MADPVLGLQRSTSSSDIHGQSPPARLACRSDTEEPTTYPIYLNYSRQVQISPNVLSTVATIHFYVWAELRVCMLADMSGKADMSCRFGHPCRHDILARSKTQTWPEHVADMSPTRHSLSAFGFGQTNRHADIWHNGLSGPKFSGKNQLNCLRKVHPVDKGLSTS